MFEIKHLDFFGNNSFDEIIEKMFPGMRMERMFEDGIPGVRVYVPRKGDTEVSKNKESKDARPEPTWRKEVRSEVVGKPVEPPKEEPVEERQPKSILEMLEDEDERLEKLLGKIIDKKLAERKLVVNDEDEDEDEDEEEETPKKDPLVFIANRLTFLIQTIAPIVFDTSSIETDENCMTVAIDEDKTFPKINTEEELGYLTCKINASSLINNEIFNYLMDTPYSNIYCFPIRVINRNDDEVWGIKFVVYPKKAE